jgi:hypothetical protein
MSIDTPEMKPGVAGEEPHEPMNLTFVGEVTWLNIVAKDLPCSHVADHCSVEMALCDGNLSQTGEFD